MPTFGKRTPLSEKHFAEFEKAYEAKERKDEGEKGRFRCFSREEIAKKDDSLDISWLKDDSIEDVADIPSPEVLVQEAKREWAEALKELDSLMKELKV